MYRSIVGLVLLAVPFRAQAQADDAESPATEYAEGPVQEEDWRLAEESEPPRKPIRGVEFTDRPLALAGIAGLGTFVGTLGAALDVTPQNWVSERIGCNST